MAEATEEEVQVGEVILVVAEGRLAQAAEEAAEEQRVARAVAERPVNCNQCSRGRMCSPHKWSPARRRRRCRPRGNDTCSGRSRAGPVGQKEEVGTAETTAARAAALAASAA